MTYGETRPFEIRLLCVCCDGAVNDLFKVCRALLGLIDMLCTAALLFQNK